MHPYAQVRPNELSNPGERAAYARVEALFDRLDRFAPVDVALIPGSHLDPEARDELLAEVERLAERLGRGELLAKAREHCREALITREVAQFRGQLGGMSPTRDPDREAAAINAVSDAVAVAVVEDQISLADADALAGPVRSLLGIEAAAGGPGPAAHLHAGHGSHDERRAAWERDQASGPVADPPGAPTERDWAEADHGATAVDLTESPVGGRPAISAALAALAVGAGLALAAGGFVAGQPVLGIAGAVAVVAVALSMRVRAADD
jgi:hypothetical protein